MVMDKFESVNITTKQARDDADILIIETALEKSITNSTALVGEYIEMLVLLIARNPPDKQFYFLKPGKGKLETKIYSSASIGNYTYCQGHISFLHAITGCDTTSALSNKGKIKCTNLNTPVKFSSHHAQLQLYYVYNQVQTRVGNELNPEEWGWVINNNLLEPIMTLQPPAPDVLLNIMFCNLTRCCGKSCGYRKVGLSAP
ncbi:hypothetical protein PR048_020360 [Dryococelus australis]|uniref:Uncharacterized protein n=1 Tax=Dryococelus australis TaxID=614101 RepID=A0ABQ9H634_9NEOP|nr:hypothetical protein PR048_020360 [Dryococelus australis]